MKKLLVVLACALVLLILGMVGCGGKESPEIFGKKYIEKKFDKINCDLEDIDYDVVDESDDTATVIIEGKIKYKEELHLVKKDGAWVIAQSAEKKAIVNDEKGKTAPAKPAEMMEGHKTESHDSPAPAAQEAHAPAARH